jgi:uncharacterized protein with beta-barrel porin domain
MSKKHISFLLVILVLLQSIPSYSLQIEVSSSEDDGEEGTLRSAILSASPGDTITFESNLDPIILDDLPLIINKDLVIMGNGPSTVIDGNNSTQIFLIESGNVTITQLSLEGGSITGEESLPGAGGALFISQAATVELNSITFAGNQAQGGEGSEELAGGNGGSAFGGAVFVQAGGSLVIKEGNFFGNSVIPGEASLDGDDGLADGKDLFLMSGSQTTIHVGEGNLLFAEIAGFDPLHVLKGGSLIKEGLGTFLCNASDSSSYDGDVSINEGLLIINDSIASDIAVNAKGKLGGAGTVGNVLNAGTVLTGSSIGALTVAGNYTHTAEGTLGIEINNSGDSTILLIEGTASINGTLHVDPLQDGSLYLAGATYPFLTASGEISGEFTEITGLGGTEAVVNQIANTQQLVLVGNIIGFSQFGGNAGEVQNYLQRVPITLGSDLANILSNLTSDPVLADALSRMTPAQYGGISWTTASLLSRANSKLAARGASICSCTNSFSTGKQEIWLDGLYDDLHQDSIQQLQGFRARSNGIFGGYDLVAFDQLRVGAAGGYTRTCLNWQESFGKSRIGTGYAGLYASYCPQRYKFDASILGAWQNYHTNREISFPGVDRVAESHSSGSAFTCHLGAERSFFYEAFELTPFVEADYYLIHQNSLVESGADSLDLNVRNHEDSFFRSNLGFAISRPFCFSWGAIIPEATLSWVWLSPISDNSITAGFIGIADTFTVATTDRAISLASPGFDLMVKLKNGLEISAAYQGNFADRIRDQEVSATLSWHF